MGNLGESTRILRATNSNLGVYDGRVPSVDTKSPENLSDFVRRIRAEKGLSTLDVERNSSNRITDGYVSQIENGYVRNVSPEKLQALAKGLGVSEDEIFAVARGAKTVGDMPLDEVRMLQLYRELPPERKEDVLAHLELACKRHAGGGNGRKNRLIPPGGRRMPVITKGSVASVEQEKKRA
jgi:transcriptional regulator with XRE-family HTH domain